MVGIAFFMPFLVLSKTNLELLCLFMDLLFSLYLFTISLVQFTKDRSDFILSGRDEFLRYWNASLYASFLFFASG